MVTRFFKIVVNPEDQRLRIPPEFVKRYGENLPKKVTLMAPTGPKQQVELVQYSNGETWLDKGWIEFKEYHSIGFAQFVMFQYDGNSHFNVFIFDTSAVEVEYAFHNIAANVDDPVAQIPIKMQAGSESDDSVVFLKAFPRHNDGNRRRYSQGNHLQRVVKKRCAAYQNAVDFKSNNPFHVAVMQPSYVAYNFGLDLPLTFAENNLPKKYNKLLLVVDGKEWEVRCNKGSTNAKVALGWKRFVLENDLKVGDACVFEVIKKSDANKPKWNVLIFRG